MAEVVVPCRLVTTYHGIGTEWLPDTAADRSKLGTGNQGKPDHTSGFFRRANAVRQLQSGDVALLKGELWEGNEGAGIIHTLSQGARFSVAAIAYPGYYRLVLTIIL